jgi:hypothetical protein
MQSGKTGMGSHKHGTTGWKGTKNKSPKLRLWLKMRAERLDNPRRKFRMYDSVKEAFEVER